MANLKDLIVNGAARIIGKTYSSEFVGNVTGNVTGNVSGNASSATKLETERSLKITDGTNTSTGVNFNGTSDVTLNLPTAYLPLAGGTMAGAIQTRTDTGPALTLRDFNPTRSTINYDTQGNEALAINLNYPSTSFMVNHGVDGSQWTTNGKWTGVTPTLQAKNKCVYINELIPNDVSPSYNLKVNGTSYFSDKVYIGSSSSYISYNSSTGALEFNC